MRIYMQTQADLAESPRFYQLSLQQDLLPSRRQAQEEVGGFTSSQQQLLRLIGYECIAVDELARLGALPVARVMADVTFLEIMGAVARTDGGYIRT